MGNFFSHDSNARNSDRLIPLRAKLGAEGYGIYFMLLERLREEPDYTSVKDYNMLAFDLRVDAAKVKAVVELFGLFSFTDDGKRFYSEGFLKRMQIKDEKSEKARQSAIKRWERKQSQSEGNANALRTKSETDAIKEKESKENTILTDSVGTHPSGCSTVPQEKKQEQSSRFTPPTLQQVEAYCREHGNRVSPVKFFNYYSSNGWRVGKNPMRDWKAAIHSWENNHYAHDTGTTDRRTIPNQPVYRSDDDF